MPTIRMSNTLNVIPSAVTVAPEESVISVPLDSVSDGLTATPTGSQTSSLLLVSKMNRITTVASAGDGVRLPPAIAGLSINVRNAASANTANVFPSSAAQGGASGGDQINALGQNTAFSLTVGANTTTFRCYTTGTWFTA